MTKAAAVFAALLTMACNTEVMFPGVTAVGNPGSSSQQNAKGQGVDITSATVFTDALIVDLCDADPVRVDIAAEVDLRDDLAVEVPGGDWCGFTVEWTPPLRIEGHDKEDPDSSFRLELEASGPALDISSPQFFVDGHALILQVGFKHWFSERELDLQPGTVVVVAPGHSIHDRLVDRADLGSALFTDDNADGRLNGDEARGVPIGSGPLFVPDEEDDS